MRWTSQDIKMYMQAKEYIDTIVIPLIPISLQNDASEICEMGEFTSILASELEREYKGRLLVLPAFTYLREEESFSLIERLNKWSQKLDGEGSKHVLFLTSDPQWKLNEKDLLGTLIWVPSISFTDLDKKYIEQVVKSQLKSIQTVVISLWGKEM
ncbi:YpiF family protein [Calidifontibacillus erzurumensis]|uniref:YpiF family protein n=1 Tax=Calidifontibacillus erzurumensis TaxID=2741433 RepID=A0A8J8K8S5_9BACI|nr:YpiF family protein [Calidifontibacillus erzurumensis]NSL52281.1 YpiF family protein [Calidifontibacillus erzurumensis]